jgi:hypothetical protein
VQVLLYVASNEECGCPPSLLPLPLPSLCARSLNLWGNHLCGTDVIQLLHAVSDNKDTVIHTLNLGANNVGMDGIRIICTSQPSAGGKARHVAHDAICHAACCFFLYVGLIP